MRRKAGSFALEMKLAQSVGAARKEDAAIVSAKDDLMCCATCEVWRPRARTARTTSVVMYGVCPAARRTTCEDHYCHEWDDDEAYRYTITAPHRATA